MEAKKYFEKVNGKVTFGAMLKATRLCEEWSQEDLAKKVGVSRMAISQFERGTSHPKPKTLIKIAKVFGLDVDSFLRYIVQDLADAYGKYEVQIKKVG